VGYFDDGDDELVVFDLIEYPIIPLANSVFFLAGQFRAARRAGILGQFMDLSNDSTAIG